MSHQKTHIESSSYQSLNRKHKASQAEAQLSPKKINVSKESQHWSKLKWKITHQEPPSSPKQLRLDNIIDPDHNEQFLNNIEKHESQDQALIKLSEQYCEPWHEDEQLKHLYKTHMNQIKDQDNHGGQTRIYYVISMTNKAALSTTLKPSSKNLLKFNHSAVKDFPNGYVVLTRWIRRFTMHWITHLVSTLCSLRRDRKSLAAK